MTFKFRKRLKFVCLVLIIVFILVIIYLNNFKDLRINEYSDKYITVQLIHDDDNDLRNNNMKKSNQLMNLTNFQYTINNDICETYKADVFGVFLITSYIGHDELRSAHRQSITQEQLKERGFLRIFLLAELPNNEKFINQKQIIDENSKFKDLVQGNFKEAYRNLTYKHLMGFKWITENCKQAKFVIKVDDDIVFDIYFIDKYLKSFDPMKTHFMAGYILSNQKTIRNQASKWYVSKEEYPLEYYPDYLSGWLYITNPVTCKKILLNSHKQSFFWIDDTFVTGIIRNKLNIPLIRLNEWFSANSQFLECCLRDSIKYFYECEYYVGPNGGDSKLIVKFINQIKKCYLKQKFCKRRPDDKSLKRTCVAEAKNLLERDHGVPFIEAVRL